MSGASRCRWEIGSRQCYLAGTLLFDRRPMCTWHHWLASKGQAHQSEGDFELWLDEGVTLGEPWNGDRAKLWAAVNGREPMPGIEEDLLLASLNQRATPGQVRDALGIATAILCHEVSLEAEQGALYESFARTNEKLREILRERDAQRPIELSPVALNLRRAFDQVRREAGITVTPVPPKDSDK